MDSLAKTEEKLFADYKQMRETSKTPLADSRLTLNCDVYIDNDYFLRERDALLRRRPVIAAVSGSLPDPNYAADVMLGGTAVVLVRNAEGRVKAFLNICRHRGSPLVTEPGKVRNVLRCPYHAWAYDLNGCAKAFGPDRGGFDGLDKAQYSLLELPVLELHGLIWVIPTPMKQLATDNLDWPDTSGFVADELSTLGLSNHRVYKRRRDRFRANWKLILDTFGETYHISSLHRDSIDPIYHTSPNLYAEQQHISRIVTFKKKVDSAADASGLMNNTIWSYFGVNAVLTRPVDHFELWQVDPISVNESEVTLTMLVESDGELTQEQEEHWEYSWNLVCSVVHEEDFKNQESIQRGLDSGAMDRIVFGRNEPGLIHFHRSNLVAMGMLEEMTFNDQQLDRKDL